MWLLSLALFLPAGGPTLRADEEVVFFPTYARQNGDKTHWLLHVHAWVFEPETNDSVRRATFDQFRQALGLKEEEARAALFRKRAWPFLADNERGRRVRIRIGAETFTLPASGADGHCRDTIRLTAESLKRSRPAGNGDAAWLPFRAVTRPGDTRKFEGKIRLVGAEGWTVVSDIDDTIKVSEVADKPALLRNTFLHEFRPVDGMAALYRRLEKDGAVFHYVSESPWQLYRPLAEFLKKEGFPEGTFHLKSFRWKDSSFFDLFTGPLDRKAKAIGPILEAFPRRKFVLVGDAGEKDPEAFGALARKYPTQVRRVLILDPAGSDRPGRYAQAFRDVPRGVWQVFRDPKEIRPLVP